jgi:hypothetical protein
MKVIIMNGGTAKTFDRNTIKIGDETLIQRTVRLLEARGIQNWYITTSQNQRIGNNYLFNESVKNDMGCMWGVYRPEFEDALFLFGDVYFTENAIDIILKGKTSFYGRSTAGILKPYGEMFAIKSDKNLWDKLFQMRVFLEKGDIPRLFSWDLYGYMQRKDFYTFGNTGNFTEIDDETDDFDTLEELENFKKLYEKD